MKELPFYKIYFNRMWDLWCTRTGNMKDITHDILGREMPNRRCDECFLVEDCPVDIKEREERRKFFEQRKPQ